MKRIILAVLIALILWFGLKDWAARVWLSSQEDTRAEPLAYSGTSGWALMPSKTTQAVWEAGWDTDVFLLIPPPAIKTHSGVVSPYDPRLVRAFVDAGHALKPALTPAGGVYAPFYRHASLADGPSQLNPAAYEDRAAAFQAYIDAHNKGRAFFIAAAGEIDPEILSRIEADPRLLERFGGQIELSTARSATLIPAKIGPPCSEAFKATNCRAPLLIRFPTSPLSFLGPRLKGERATPVLAKDADPSALAERRAGFLQWLEDNAQKSAEPLGGFEDVEIAPIRTPGQMDTPPEKED